MKQDIIIMNTHALIIGKDKNGHYRYGQSFHYGEHNTEWLQKNLNSAEQVEEFLLELTEGGENGCGRGVNWFGYKDSKPVIFWDDDNYNCGIAIRKEELLDAMHLDDTGDEHHPKIMTNFDHPEYLSFWNGREWLGVGWNTLEEGKGREENWKQFSSLVINSTKRDKTELQFNNAYDFGAWIDEEMAGQVLAEFWHWYKEEEQRINKLGDSSLIKKELDELGLRLISGLPLPSLDTQFSICGKWFEVRDALSFVSYFVFMIADAMPDSPYGWQRRSIEVVNDVKNFACGFYKGAARVVNLRK